MDFVLSHNFEITFKMQLKKSTVCRQPEHIYQITNRATRFFFDWAVMLSQMHYFNVNHRTVVSSVASQVSKFWIDVDFSILCKFPANLEYPCIHRY